MKKILLLLLFPILLLEHANAGLFTKKTTDPEITAFDNYAKQFKATSDACAQASTAIQAKIDDLTKNGAGGKGGDPSTIASCFSKNRDKKFLFARFLQYMPWHRTVANKNFLSKGPVLSRLPSATASISSADTR